MGLFLGLFLASILPLLVLGIIHKTDFYQTGQFRLILVSLCWGIFAYLLASWANSALQTFGKIDRETVNRFIAPVLEEILKGMILLYLIRLSKFTYSIDGALYGFAAGIGFAIFENFEFILNNPSMAIPIAVGRVLSADMVHASSSAIIGITAWIFFLRRNWWRWLVLAFGLSLGIGQHMFFNIAVDSAVSPLIAIGTVILGIVIVFVSIQQGKRQARKWIKEKLGLDDRITRGEVAMVDRIANPDEFLLPVLERFGPKTASQVEKLLYLQARLGIKRKTLDSFKNNISLRDAMQTEVNKINVEIDEVRHAIGIYPMLFVRRLFTDEIAPVWDRMQAKIQERSVANGDQKGGGVWSSLEEHLEPSTDAERPKESV